MISANFSQNYTLQLRLGVEGNWLISVIGRGSPAGASILNHDEDLFNLADAKERAYHLAKWHFMMKQIAEPPVEREALVWAETSLN